MTIISLAEKRLEQNDDIIEVLEEVLQMAKDGTIRDLAITYVTDEKTAFSRARYENRLRLLGGVAFLQYDLLTKHD